MRSKQPAFIVPDWPAPANVEACSTCRQGGVSEAPFASLNLGDHVGDASAAVAINRQHLQRSLQLPSVPYWLMQTHSKTVVEAVTTNTKPQADASFTAQSGVVCVVLTADCLPLLLCDEQGRHVAAIHAGWRGLCDGVIEATLASLPVAPQQLLVWFGPAIGPTKFEVGDEVRAQFVAADVAASRAFEATNAGHWLADLYALARLRLQSLGVLRFYGGEHCTYTESERFFSYRRDGVSGRMASLIWLTS